MANRMPNIMEMIEQFDVNQNLMNNLYLLDMNADQQEEQVEEPEEPARCDQFDLRSNTDSYEIWVNVPGFKKEHIKVSLDGNVLKIVTKKTKSPEKDLAIRHRFPGNLLFVIRLKTPIDIAKTKSSLEDGVFYLKLRKQAVTSEINIPI